MMETCTYTNNHNKHVYMYTCVYIYMCVYVYMAVSQNCVWNVPRCSGRMERRGFVTVLVPDLWSVMKYKLYIHMYIYVYIIIYIYTYCKYVCSIHLRGMLVKATHAGCRSFSLLISARHPCCTPVQRRFALHG